MIQALFRGGAQLLTRRLAPLVPFGGLQRRLPLRLLLPFYHLIVPDGRPAPAHVRALYPVRGA